jgi:peroxiredoxin Q/BCP
MPIQSPVEGELMPDFSLSNQADEAIKLSDYRGKNAVVVYFYPKSNTPGCTVEACEFRDWYTKFTEAGAVVLGISPDSVKKQSNFVNKHQLPFHILADIDHKLTEQFGLWKEKTLWGRKYMGVDRVTFLIDKKGVLRKVFPKVTPEGHAEEVLAAIKEL